ncbi:phage tail protein [Pseudacidovorax intermedius]|uniref:phage tail protein n=1 Tax=Pseudacidovorax intermedius TaxID=433924 RepID=UPI0026F0901D|nr:phage tail protein [Pseudacidovorax intermedius]
MKKPQLLRDHITRACPDLATNPEKLTIFIERGNVLHTGTPALSFEYAYTLNLVVTDWADSPDVLVVPVIAWLKQHQPDLFDNPERRAKGFRFEAEVIDHQKADIAIELDLTETVAVAGGTVDGVNRLTTRHIGEPLLAGSEPPESVIDLQAEWRIQLLDQTGA